MLRGTFFFWLIFNDHKTRNGVCAGMPLPPMSPLWREHGKGEGGGGIHITICCCNEEEEELQVSSSKRIYCCMQSS